MIAPTRAAIAEAIDPQKAQRAVADMVAALGSAYEWNSETVEWLAEYLAEAVDGLDLPSFDSQSDTALAFWQEVEG